MTLPLQIKTILVTKLTHTHTTKTSGAFYEQSTLVDISVGNPAFLHPGENSQ
jgi:hypothetical protein